MLLVPRVMMAALIVIPALLWYFCGRTLRQRFVRCGLAVGVVLGIWGICYVSADVISQVRAQRLDGSVWMPRYLGFVWPAVGLAVAALLARLPTRGFRYVAIAAFLAVNLAQAYGRVMIGNEAPVDRVVADVQADRADPQTLTFVFPMRETEHVRFTGAPGTTQIFGTAGRYYFSLGDPRIERYEQVHHGNLQRMYGLRRVNDRSAIRKTVAQTPEARRVIIWEQLDLDQPTESQPDPILEVLGEQWTLAGEQVHHVRFYWTWGDLYDYRRREYHRKIEQPAEQAAVDDAAIPPLSNASGVIP